MACAVANIELDSAAISTVSLEKSPACSGSAIWVVAAALIGLFFKLIIAYNTCGTNDVVTFYRFARSLSDHGLEWTYHRSTARSFSLFVQSRYVAVAAVIDWRAFRHHCLLTLPHLHST